MPLNDLLVRNIGTIMVHLMESRGIKARNVVAAVSGRAVIVKKIVKKGGKVNG